MRRTTRATLHGVCIAVIALASACNLSPQPMPPGVGGGGPADSRTTFDGGNGQTAGAAAADAGLDADSSSAVVRSDDAATLGAIHPDASSLDNVDGAVEDGNSTDGHSGAEARDGG